MQIWIDADSCPRPVRDTVQRAAHRLHIHAHFAANKPVPGLEGPWSHYRLCPEGADKADDYIVESSEPGDLAVTRDIPLATRLVEAGICVIDDRGQAYTPENIREKLSIRDFSVGLAMDGLGGPRMRSWGAKELKEFANSFDRNLTRLLREETAVKGDEGKDR